MPLFTAEVSSQVVKIIKQCADRVKLPVQKFGGMLLESALVHSAKSVNRDEMTKEQVYVKNRFARSQLVDEFELPEGNEVVDVLSDEICGESRWTVTYDLIFRLPGQPEDEAWSTTYERGKTEAQEMPIWDGENEIECLLVRRKRVETYEWQPVLQQTLAESKKDE